MPALPECVSSEERAPVRAERKSESSRVDETARGIIVGMLCAMPAVISLRGAEACVGDPDLGWHLQTAQWILAHRGLPHTDPFSRLAAAPWQAYSWLFELVLLKLWNWLGLEGIVVLTALLLAALSVAVYRMVSRLNTDFSICALITLAVMFAISRMSTPRPWLFTLVFFALELDILMQVRQSGRARKLLWLPPLFAVWANVHIQFADGLLLLGIAACEPLLGRWWKGAKAVPARPLWLTLAACLGATLINPYGAGLYRSAWELGSQAGVLNSITEMQSLPFRSASDFVLLFLALVAAGVLFRFLDLAPFETLLLAAAAVISFRSQRDLWFMAMVAGVVIAEGLPGRSEGAAGKGSPTQRSPAPGWMVPAISMATAALLTLVSAAVLHDTNERLATLQAKAMPVKAVEVVKARGYAGPVFNTYGWGGFLIWKLGQPVTIDGRAALYGDARIDRSRKTWGGQPDWEKDPDLQSAGIVVAPVDEPLTQLLKRDARFDLAYEDKLAAVFVPKQRRKAGEGQVAELDDAVGNGVNRGRCNDETGRRTGPDDDLCGDLRERRADRVSGIRN